MQQPEKLGMPLSPLSMQPVPGSSANHMYIQDIYRSTIHKLIPLNTQIAVLRRLSRSRFITEQSSAAAPETNFSTVLAGCSSGSMPSGLGRFATCPQRVYSEPQSCENKCTILSLLGQSGNPQRCRWMSGCSQLCAGYSLRAAVAGTYTGEHWLDQVMQLPGFDSQVLVFTQSGMAYAVTVDQLPMDEGSCFGDLAMSKVRILLACCRFHMHDIL